MLVERIELSLVVVVVVLIVVLVAVVGLQVVASLVVHGLLQAGLVAKLVLVVYSGVSEGMASRSLKTVLLRTGSQLMTSSPWHRFMTRVSVGRLELSEWKGFVRCK